MILVLTLAIGLAAVTGVREAGSVSAPSINQVQLYPLCIVTPHDRYLVRANVTSETGIADVSIYSRTGPSGLTFKSVYDFDRAPMFRTGSIYNGVWEHQFENKSAGTTIYFFIAATDSAGINSTWYNYVAPFEVSIEEPRASYLDGVYLYLNDIMLNNRFQGANITVSVHGYFSDFPEDYWKTVVVTSSGYYVAYLDMFEACRFYYSGEASGIASIEGDFGAKPYDKYDLEVTMEIPAVVRDFSRISDHPIPLFTRPFSGYDMWNVSFVSQGFGPSADGQKALVQVRYVLSRSPPDFYPPLILMLASYSVLGLAPLTSMIPGYRRADLFFVVIGLIATALLSEKINPFGPFQSSIFEVLFAVVLLSTIIMVAVSILSQMLKSHRVKLEASAVVAIIAINSIAVSTTNLPSWAQVLSPIALIFGSFLLILINGKKVVKAALDGLKKYAETATATQPDTQAVSTPVPTTSRLGRLSAQTSTSTKEKRRSRNKRRRTRRRG